MFSSPIGLSKNNILFSLDFTKVGQIVKNFITFLTFVFSFAACQKNAQITEKPTAKTSAAISANVAPSVSASANTKIKIYDGRGVVTKINLELISVELDHEEIKGLMPKMMMEFYVKEKSDLEKLKVGDEVEFVLEDNAGAEQIVSIKKIR